MLCVCNECCENSDCISSFPCFPSRAWISRRERKTTTTTTTTTQALCCRGNSSWSVGNVMAATLLVFFSPLTFSRRTPIRKMLFRSNGSRMCCSACWRRVPSVCVCVNVDGVRHCGCPRFERARARSFAASLFTHIRCFSARALSLCVCSPTICQSVWRQWCQSRTTFALHEFRCGLHLCTTKQ